MAQIKKKSDNPPWEVVVLKKAEKQVAKLPSKPVDVLSEFFALQTSLEWNGPEQPEFENYGKLKNRPKGEEWHHCHLNTKIKNILPEYVAVWYVDRDERIVEINHVATHEKTDYDRFRKKK